MVLPQHDVSVALDRVISVVTILAHNASIRSRGIFADADWRGGIRSMSRSSISSKTALREHSDFLR